MRASSECLDTPVLAHAGPPAMYRPSPGSGQGPREASPVRGTGVFTYSPIGPVKPTGQHLEWEVIGTFRYDDEGRVAEEWVQTDYRSFLTKLGVTTAEYAQQGS